MGSKYTLSVLWAVTVEDDGKSIFGWSATLSKPEKTSRTDKTYTTAVRTICRMSLPCQLDVTVLSINWQKTPPLFSSRVFGMLIAQGKPAVSKRPLRHLTFDDR